MHKVYRFDNIVIKISTVSFFQYTDDHNMIFWSDRIYFACLNYLYKNKALQPDDEKHYVITSQ